MKKVKTMFLMLFLILSGALCHVSGVAGTEIIWRYAFLLGKRKNHRQPHRQ